jgi:hypothetical protein
MVMTAPGRRDGARRGGRWGFRVAKTDCSLYTILPLLRPLPLSPHPPHHTHALCSPAQGRDGGHERLGQCGRPRVGPRAAGAERALQPVARRRLTPPEGHGAAAPGASSWSLALCFPMSKLT